MRSTKFAESFIKCDQRDLMTLALSLLFAIFANPILNGQGFLLHSTFPKSQPPQVAPKTTSSESFKKHLTILKNIRKLQESNLHSGWRGQSLSPASGTMAEDSILSIPRRMEPIQGWE